MKKNVVFYGRHLWAGIVAVAVLMVCGCSGWQAAPTVEGSYTYAHAFSYDLDGNHFDVDETGTMDFHADGTAFDSARQVYRVKNAVGDTSTLVFTYVSPSRWRLEGDDLYFVGIKDLFRMTTVGGADTLAQRIVDVVGGSIDYEYRFHLDTLTDERLQWSFTYRDGHSDTWVFVRDGNAAK